MKQVTKLRAKYDARDFKTQRDGQGEYRYSEKLDQRLPSEGLSPDKRRITGGHTRNWGRQKTRYGPRIPGVRFSLLLSQPSFFEQNQARNKYPHGGYHENPPEATGHYSNAGGQKQV